MNFKKQAIVAAAILAVAGAANAKVSDIIVSGNSSLAFVALDTVAKTSTVVDLGTTFKDFLPQGTSVNVLIPGDGSVASGIPNTANALTYTPGTTLSWNFTTNTFTVNGAAQTTALNGKAIDWSAYSTFKAGTTTANTKWGVIAGGTGLYNLDTTLDVNDYGAQGPVVQIATTQAATPVIDSATIANAGGKVTTLFANSASQNNSSNVLATVASVGASAYAGNDAQFGVAGKWGNELAQSALAAIGTSQGFYYTNELPLDGNAGAPLVVKYDGTFAFNGTTLTYTVPGAVTPSVPEPEGYALAFVGLAAVGFAARRRQA
jgi:hypothetical protein